jgi:hypothetical protein
MDPAIRARDRGYRASWCAIPYPTPSDRNRSQGVDGLRGFRVLLRATALTACLTLFGCKEKPTPPTEPPPALPVQKAPAPPPLPVIPYKKLEIAKLFNGISLKTSFEAEAGAAATVERQDPASYELDLRLRVRVPTPHSNLDALLILNPDLAKMLPKLGTLMASATVSPLFEEFYRRKIANIQSNLSKLESLLSRHNFFDIETILEIQDPDTGRRAILVQSDMDVDTDGSDGDRLSITEGVSTTFQPFTSYRWPKKTRTANPFLSVWEKKLKDCEREMSGPKLNANRQKELKDQQTELKNEINDLKKSSFLIGSIDPFVVLPLPMVSRKDGPSAAKIGDYCVVIHQRRMFPAIVGDAGPSYKSGEASLRICREINEKAGSNNRAESDLRVTYIVFPGTSDSPREAPNLMRWWIRCNDLLKEIGGYLGDLFFFPLPDQLKPAPLPGDPNFIGPLIELYGPPLPPGF